MYSLTYVCTFKYQMKLKLLEDFMFEMSETVIA